MAAMAFHPPAASYAVLKRGQDPAKPTVAPIATQIMTGGDAGPPDADPGPSNVQGGETFALEAASDELWAGPPLPTPDTADDEDSGLGEYKVIITNREIKRLCRELNALKPTEATRITTSSGTTISGLFVRAQGVTARHTLLFSHGNAVDIGEMLPFWALMSANLGVNVFGYEYTGYGDSTGAEAPTEDQTYRDIQAAYDHVASVTSTSIVLYGQSVGSGPTCHLASRRKVAGVILHSPMASGLRVLRPPQEQCTANICHPSCCLSCCDIFPNSNRIANASAPVLILHGLEDEVIHVGNAHLLHKKTPTPFKVDPWLVPGGGHNNLFDTDPDGCVAVYRERIH